jgi:hypothetical protein
MALQQNLDGTDWQDDKGLGECMIHMLTEEIMCDVTFRVGSYKNILGDRKIHSTGIKEATCQTSLADFITESFIGLASL